MKEALVVFAKAPVAGQVKTRLFSTLTPEQATALYVCFLQDTFALMEAVQAEREELALVLCYAPADEIKAFEVADLDGCLLLAQRGEDLGARLRNCYDDLFEAGFHSIVILGADSPTLPDEFVLEAFARLQETPVVIGPTADGGYYLIGLTRACPALFANLAWSTTTVLAQTQARAAAAGLSWSLLPEWYDIDTPEDLNHLREQLAASPSKARRTSKYLHKLSTKP
jgi:hypothetical protein